MASGRPGTLDRPLMDRHYAGPLLRPPSHVLDPVRSLLSTIVLLLVVAAPAHAKMEIAMQDDASIVYGYSDRELALDQFVAMGGTNVRINFEHRRGRAFLRRTDIKYSRPLLESYDSAVRTVLDHGLEPQITLVWHGQQDPGRFAVWAANVATHFGDQVTRYSIINEPDLLLEVGSHCNAAGQRRFVRKFPRLVVRSGKSYRAKVLTKKRTMNLQVACFRYWRGRIYRTIVNDVARSIHDVAPDAEILAGETSAQPGIDWFARGVRPTHLRGIDGWAHHPFQLHTLTPGKPFEGTWGIGNLRLVKRVIRLPLYYTEFGYPHPNSSMDKRAFGRRLKPSEVARTLVKAWKVAKRSGARQMLQYQWFLKPKFRHDYWETALMDHDDGSTTPAYRALKRLILSW
jgi:hypothetical protein